MPGLLGVLWAVRVLAEGLAEGGEGDGLDVVGRVVVDLAVFVEFIKDSQDIRVVAGCRQTCVSKFDTNNQDREDKGWLL